MSDLVKAIFEHGAFVPETPCDLPEGTRVLLAIQHEGLVRPPEVDDREERARILLTVVERMKGNPLPLNAPRFRRDEMHERG